MVKVIYKKDKKYLIIDGKEYGPKSLYYHIVRTINTYKHYKTSGEWDLEKVKKVKYEIAKLIKIHKKYYPEENIGNLVIWLNKTICCLYYLLI